MIQVFWDTMLYRWANMKTTGSFETSGITHTTTRRHMPEDLNPQYHRCEHKTSAIAVCTMTTSMLTQFGLLPRGTESDVWDNRERTAAHCDKPRFGIRRTEDTERHQMPERSVTAALLSA